MKAPFTKRRIRPLVPWLLLLAAARCGLPNGEDSLPVTDAPGVKRDVKLRVMLPPADRKVGVTLPLTVDVEIANAERLRVKLADDEPVCVKLIASPGVATFPFGSDCPKPVVEASAAVDGGAGTGGVAGAGGSGLGENESARVCLIPRSNEGAPKLLDGRAAPLVWTARSIATYQPQASETTVTVVAALYQDATCSGPVWETTAVEFPLGNSAIDGAGGTNEGGAGPGGAPNGGAGNAPVGGAPPGGASPIGGASPGGTGPVGGGGGTDPVGGGGGASPIGGAGGVAPNAGQGGD